MTEYKIDNLACFKAVIHSIQHPSSHVMGLLIGSQFKAGGKDVVHITNVVPMFHNTPLTPTLNTAVSMVSAWLQSKKDEESKDPEETIVGIYSTRGTGAAGSSAKLPNIITQRATAGIVAEFPNAGLLVVDEAALSDATKIPLKLYQLQSGSWVPHSYSSDGAHALNEALENSKNPSLVDFDDHFDDPMKDWRNIMSM